MSEHVGILINPAVSEFNEFEPRPKSAQKQVSIERRLKSWNIEYTILSETNYIWTAAQILKNRPLLGLKSIQWVYILTQFTPVNVDFSYLQCSRAAAYSTFDCTSRVNFSGPSVYTVSPELWVNKADTQ